MAKRSTKDSAAGTTKTKTTDATKTVKKGEAGVYVYCKLPNGMQFQTPFGVVVLKGTNDAQIVGGYGRTFVSQKAWEYILSVYGGMKVFNKSNPVIFEAEKASYGDDAAKEQGEDTTTGMEQKAPSDIIKKAEATANNKQPENDED